MKLHHINIKNIVSLLLLSGAFVSCEDFLDKEPPAKLLPTDYYQSEDQVQACANQFYADVLPSHSGAYGIFAFDNSTDNQTGRGADNKYAPGQWKVGMDNGNWSWGTIRNINYQLNTILERYNNKQINGTDKNICQYIGELYFFRAYKYFDLLRQWGDLPIIKEAFPDDEAILVAASTRSPRNEVARFILGDLDTAIEYMSENFESRHTRVSPDVARIVKSRVALFEASWLNNFKGTPFVPLGEGWPGKEKDYNAGYQYPANNIDAEIKYFFEIAAKEAETIADKYKGSLVTNTGIVPQSAEQANANPYFNLFGNTDMTPYKEVLLWREYNKGLGICNNVEVAIQHGNWANGVTRGMVEGFVMADGKPRYDSQYAYDDNSIAKVRENRDPRFTIFLKEPGQINVFKNMQDNTGDQIKEIEDYPHITEGSEEYGNTTGYTLRKGGTFDRSLTKNWNGYTAAICFRATEALLNYMEAEYMLTHSVASGKILEYWRLIREKAGFTGVAVDPQVTIDATDMNEETKGLDKGEAYDWGAFTAGKPIDKELYCIRRERRCELMAEGLRWMDLIRWRSLDQLVAKSYHIEGFRLWNSDITAWYNFTPDKYDGSSSAQVSSPNLGNYLRPYEKNMSAGNMFKDGFRWSMAQYLQPLPLKQFLLTSPDYSTMELSPLYQNPYWPMTADQPAEK